MRVETHRSSKGNLHVIPRTLFQVQRMFWIEGVPLLGHRGQHAHKKCYQQIVVMKGDCLAITTERKDFVNTTVLLEEGDILYVPPMTWLDLTGFSSDALICVLASDLYDEEDYIRSYGAFVESALPRSADEIRRDSP